MPGAVAVQQRSRLRGAGMLMTYSPRLRCCTAGQKVTLLNDIIRFTFSPSQHNTSPRSV